MVSVGAVPEGAVGSAGASIPPQVKTSLLPLRSLPERDQRKKSPKK